MTGQAGFLGALSSLTAALDELDASAMVIGGVAVIAHGVPRLTVDIDATVTAAGLDVDRMVETLGRHAITARIPDASAFARAHQVWLGAHVPTGTPIDISLAWLPFEEDALRSAVACDYGGVALRIPRPEDLLIYKVIASRPRDLDDAEGLLALHGAEMDLHRVRRVVAEFARVLDDDERPRTLERLIEKTRAPG